ncbi:MAG TPA: hypothetical protein PKO06_06360 [Candidatus Ozemobacteraceae bacterium]|nr:hypothetical protein [Candidatus Ozemobacteraceae bacterium]
MSNVLCITHQMSEAEVRIAMADVAAILQTRFPACQTNVFQPRSPIFLKVADSGVQLVYQPQRLLLKYWHPDAPPPPLAFSTVAMHLIKHAVWHWHNETALSDTPCRANWQRFWPSNAPPQ